MAGEERATSGMVLAMLRGLPAHSRLSASTFDPASIQRDPDEPEEPEESPEDIDWFTERRTWDKPEMQMLARMVNIMGQLLLYTPPPQGVPSSKIPTWDPIGPPEWRMPEVTKMQKPATVFDVMRIFGYQGTPQESEASVNDVMKVFGYTEGTDPQS